MPAYTLKTIGSGVIATVLGGLIVLWIAGIGPFASPKEERRLTEDHFVPEQKSGSHRFRFHSPTMRFYEGEGKTVEPADRAFSDTFYVDKARFIYFELTIQHPPLEEDAPFQALIVYKNGAGEELTRMNYEGLSQKGWKGSQYTWGWGSEAKDYWKPGQHSVEIYYSGNLLISRPFVLI